jgi:hypothetical protein
VSQAGLIDIEKAVPTIPTSFDTDGGTAIPVANVLEVLGGTGLTTAGAGNVVTITMDTPVTVANGGTGVSTMTDGGIVLGSGTDAVTVTSQPTDGQLLIGSTGNDPVLSTLTAGSGILISSDPGSITITATAVTPTTYEADTGDATPIGNILDIVGGPGISTVGSTNVITINASGGGFSWLEVTTTPTLLTANTGHYINTGALCTLTLPTTPNDDDIIRIVGVGAGGWKVNCGVGQQIIYGVLSSTVDTGSLESSHRRDCVTLKYLGSGVWEGIDSVGNLGVI